MIPPHLQQIVGFLLYHPQEGHHVGVGDSAAAHGLRQGLPAEDTAEKVLHPVLFSATYIFWGGGVKTRNGPEVARK